jgi:hypothetical protein
MQQKRSGQDYLDFTQEARIVIEIFLLAAVEHYAYFHYRRFSA